MRGKMVSSTVSLSRIGERVGLCVTILVALYVYEARQEKIRSASGSNLEDEITFRRESVGGRGVDEPSIVVQGSTERRVVDVDGKSDGQRCQGRVG